MLTQKHSLDFNKTNLRSFSRRIGKSLSNLQLSLIKDVLPEFYSVKENPFKNSKDYDSVCIEVGIGMAEHFVNQCSINPKTLFLGVEPYLNGIANCLKLAAEHNISNFELWPDDADQILESVPENSVSNFYLLFPDPWPKTKQKKRRFASKERLMLIKSLLKKDGCFIFVSDIEDYASEVEVTCNEVGMKKVSIDYHTPHDGYITTKYHSKAILEGRKPHFMKFEKHEL